MQSATRKNRIALSVDVEDWFHSRHVSSLEQNPNQNVQDFFQAHDKGWDLLTRPVNQLLEIFQEQQILATFFLVAGLKKKYETLYKKITDQNHEIACHDLNHVGYMGQGDAQEQRLFITNVTEAKKQLEDICGRRVLGYRAPAAYFRSWMVPLLYEMGFVYDSSVSVNSLYNKTDSNLIGISTAPYRIGTRGLLPDTTGQMLELPWPYYNFMGFKLPTPGGPALRLAGLWPTWLGLRQSLERGDTMFYIHPLDISDEPLPQIIQTARKTFWINRGPKTMRKFCRILNLFKGRYCSCEKIVRTHLHATTVEVPFPKE